MPSTTDPSGRVLVVPSSLSSALVPFSSHSETVVDGAAEGIGSVVVDVVVVEVAPAAGVLVVGEPLVVEVEVEEVAGVVVTVGVVGVPDGPSEVQEGKVSTRVAARARPVDRLAGRRGRSR